MIDLYKRIGLTPDASVAELRSRLTTITNQRVKRAVQEILLDPERREVYDRNHRTVRMIGQLRANMGLSQGANWLASNASDFETTSTRREPLLSQLEKDSRSTGRGRSSRRGRKGAATDGAGRSSQDHSSKGKKRSRSNSSASTDKSRGILWRMLGGIKRAVVGLLLWLLPYALLFGGCGVIIMVADSCEDDVQETASRSARSSSSPSLAGELRSKTQSSNRSPSVPEEPKFDEPVQPLPENGAWWKYRDEEHVAPLRIETRWSGSHHYYVKVHDRTTGSPVLTVFVRGGQTAEVKVPVGTHGLKYATGTTWYGREHLFGPDTKYSKASQPFEFNSTGYQVSGYTVQLYRQRDGNLHTYDIDKDEF